MWLCSKGDVLNIEDKKSRFERRKEQKKEQKKKERIKNNGTGKFYVYF